MKQMKYLIVMGIIVLGGLYLFYLAFLDGVIINKPIIFKETINLKTDKDTYHAGDTVKVYLTFCKYRNLTANLQDALVDDHLILFDTIQRNSGILGCKTDLLTDFEKIPLDTFSDTYHLNRVLKYQVNPLRIMTYELSTKTFKIEK